MRRMSSDPTFPQPVGDPIDPAGATPILPSPAARIAEPHRAGDGSLIDGGYLTTQLTATDGISVDGIAPRSLEVTAPQDTAQRASDLSGLASQFAAPRLSRCSLRSNHVVSSFTADSNISIT